MDQETFSAIAAAKDAAFWAGASAIAAYIGLFLTGSGMVFLWFQLKLNREAVELARRSATSAEAAVRASLADSRPWIMLGVEEGASAHFRLRPTPAVSVMLTATAKNVGKSPALAMRTHVMPLYTGSDGEIRAALEGFASATMRATSTLFPDEERRFTTGRWVEIDEVPARAPIAQAILAVEYRSAASNEVHWTTAYVCEFPGADVLPGPREVKIYQVFNAALQPS